ncbi:hypothetical protein [Streptomyces sediminimaris]|uniref:hypothetical protein n=1 Tax=Streptomyces sediminimaris TaxID=3383721 RepID=UPI00399B6508
MAHAPSRGEAGALVSGPVKAHRDVRRAWWTLLLLFPAFVAAVFLGDWLLSLQGYDDSDASVPLGTTLVAGGCALLVLIAPPLAALFYGLRGHRHGDPGGLAPALVGGITAVVLVVLNVVALVTGR